MDNQEAREMAAKLVTYYQRLVLDDAESWQLGLETAKSWLRLVDNPNPDLLEIEKLITTLEAHDEGSAWYEMLLAVKRWKKHL